MGYLSLQQACKGLREIKKGYTLIELLVVLTIILVLATIGMFLYNRSIAFAQETVCQTNLITLEKAIELYVIENDAIPASLGHLKLEHLEKGYAKAMEDGGWFTKFSFFLVKLDASKQAYAQFLTYENLENYGATKKIFQGPADSNGGASYGINGNLAGKKWSDVDAEEIIIADSDNYVFNTLTELAKRHNNKALAIKKTGKIIEVDEVYGGGDETICHKPGTPAERTMTISNTAVPGHIGHGDTIGTCS
jgi:prepilin-type N-terminal cleavage/methylation domain-containing protein